MTSLETARSLANYPSGEAEGEFPRNCSVSYISFVYGSTGGVCGRSLTAGKILFTGRQTCSLYLVLWLCVMSTKSIFLILVTVAPTNRGTKMWTKSIFLILVPIALTNRGTKMSTKSIFLILVFIAPGNNHSPWVCDSTIKKQTMLL